MSEAGGGFETRAFAPSRRMALGGLAAFGSALLIPGLGQAQVSSLTFPAWVASFKATATAKGISPAVYDRVMAGVAPDTEVFRLINAQPEVKEQIWQYLNRRVTDWRIGVGKQRIKEYGGLLKRIEQTYGVDPYLLTGLWGMESAFGEVLNNPKAMRPIFPCLAALAWGEARRRKYWETELVNALKIVQKGWADPTQMTGSWAGAMGHTQWMPEVWLNVGVDFDGDGKIFPFGKPDDALAGTATYLLKRGRYRRGEDWGYEVADTGNFNDGLADFKTIRTVGQWEALGLRRADGKPFPNREMQARARFPMGLKGPGFLCGQNFMALRSYNPSFNYALAIAILADRIEGKPGIIQPWPGGERALTLAETQEIQTRLTALGFDTGGTDGRVGSGTFKAVKAYQEQVGLTPADGFPGERVLNRLRQGR